jgi:hypothetical protein
MKLIRARVQNCRSIENGEEFEIGEATFNLMPEVPSCPR